MARRSGLTADLDLGAGAGAGGCRGTPGTPWRIPLEGARAGPSESRTGIPGAKPQGGAAAQGAVDLSVAVFVAADVDGLTLVRELQRTRARVMHAWPPPAVFTGDFDVVVSEAFDGLPSWLPWTPGMAASALVVVLRDERHFDTTLLHHCAPQATLSLPARRLDVRAALATAWSLHRYERRLRARIDKLDEHLRSLRSVERAKLLIMQRKGLTENDAYHLLRREAMARQMAMSELAASIVDTENLLS